MVEKIIVSPNEVRAYGNVVESKEVEDYLVYNCTLSQRLKSVNNVSRTVNILSYD